jgi:hypothetical protein
VRVLKDDIISFTVYTSTTRQEFSTYSKAEAYALSQSKNCTAFIDMCAKAFDSSLTSTLSKIKNGITYPINSHYFKSLQKGSIC